MSEHVFSANAHLSNIDSAYSQVAGLLEIMNTSKGIPSISIAVLDGMPDVKHNLFSGRDFLFIDKNEENLLSPIWSNGAPHATAVLGILASARSSEIEGLCPDASFIVCPILSGSSGPPNCSLEQLANAITKAVDANAKIINISASISSLPRSHTELEWALNYAGRQETLIIAASGNQFSSGSTILTRHNNVIPVVGLTRRGELLGSANTGASIGRNGVCAPGELIRTLSPNGGYQQFTGSSAAAAVTTGAVCLLWSLFPTAPAHMIRHAVRLTNGMQPSSVPCALNLSIAMHCLAHQC
jgi:subtilisin family serine protease